MDEGTFQTEGGVKFSKMLKWDARKGRSEIFRIFLGLKGGGLGKKGVRSIFLSED